MEMLNGDNHFRNQSHSKKWAVTVELYVQRGTSTLVAYSVCVFLCDRRSPRHVCYDRREVSVWNDGLREEPGTNERPAGTAASPGHRPANLRSPRHQRAAVLFIDRSTHTHKHTNTHIHTQRLWSDVRHTHTQQTHTERLGALLLPKKTKKKTWWHNRICFSVCS